MLIMTHELDTRTWDAIHNVVKTYGKAKTMLDKAKEMKVFVNNYKNSDIVVLLQDGARSITLTEELDKSNLQTFLMSCAQNAETEIKRCGKVLLSMVQEEVDA
jgi:predicted SpoU family rRNA methylase